MTNYWKHAIDLLLLIVSMQLDMSHINNKIYLERKKCITSMTLFNA